MRALARAHGVGFVAGQVLSSVWQFAIGLPRPLIGTRRTFSYGGVSYRYLVHRYNWTWLNERAVEVPIAQEAVARAAGRRVLEVGNVLAHYGPIRHRVIDRYERAPGVTNVDILGFDDGRGFDLIVSVSTLEHVGWDELPRDPGAASRAFDHLAGLLAPGGELLVTFPVGYNTELDASVRAGRLAAAEVRGLRREAGRNRWREAELAEVWKAPYDHMLRSARGIVVCTVRRSVA